MSRDKNSFKILIADDEEPIIDSLSQHFTRWGYTCEGAADGEEALARIMASPPDLLVTDIKMPRLDGLQLIGKIKDEGLELPVVVITAYFDIENAITALRLGAVNFFKKPFDFPAIHNAVFKLEKMKASRIERVAVLNYLEKGDMRFVIPSNIDLIDGVSNYVTERAVEFGVIPSNQKFYIQLAIDEAISNAILHGNLRIKELEADADNAGKTREELYRLRCSQPDYATKKVYVDAIVNPGKLEVAVTDEGHGFDYSLLPDPTDDTNVFDYHGRGIFVMRNIMDYVEFSNKGSSIRLIKNKINTLAN